jgi:hypothetical protein
MPRASRIRLYHPDYGWGDVVRMSADGHLLVNFPSPNTGRWIDPAAEGVTLEGAARLRQLQRPASQWGYCWNCNKLSPLRLVATEAPSREGYECPHCRAISRRPHSTCRNHGAACTMHPPVDPDGDPLPGYYRSPAGLWKDSPWKIPAGG